MLIENKANHDNKFNNNSLIYKKINSQEMNYKNINDDYSEINQSIISKDINRLEFLLKSGKNPNICNPSGETPIFKCIELNDFESLIILLKYGANTNIKNNKGNTPLHISIIKKNEKIIIILLDDKANPNIKNSDFQTPFHLAIINKLNKNILVKFKENNVDWNIKDKFGKTPFDYALKLNDKNYLSLLDNIFGKQTKNLKNMNDINANNYKVLPNKIVDTYYALNKKIIYKCNDDNKENNNNYNYNCNPIGETNANTMSEIYSQREYNNLNSKNKFVSLNEFKENIDNNNRIYDIRNFTLAKNNLNLEDDDYFINEKENIDCKIKSCGNLESKEIMKEIIMDTIKKVKHFQTYNKSSSKKNLEEELNNNFKKIIISERLNSSSINKLNSSEVNNINSGISTTILDDTEINTINKTNLEETFKRESKNDIKKIEQITLKDLIDKNNDSIKYKRKDIQKKNLTSSNIKYMILQQIKEKNKNLELGSPLIIPNEILSKLRYWLISCDLLNYYNLLLEKKLYNIDEIISLMKNKKVKIDFKYVEELGIKKPGHIFRFLLKLQIDSEILNKQLCDKILEKFSINNSSTISLNTNSNYYKCCGISCCSHSAVPSNVSDTINNINNNDIFSFLRNKDLIEFKDNFLHNGFDQVDYLIIQLFSEFKFDKDMMNEYFHIYVEKSQIKIIKKLYEEKEKISKELNIPYDNNELKEILESYKDKDKEEKKNTEDCIIY